MSSTFQFKTQSVLEHGQSVNRHYHKIIDALNNKDLTTYQFPDILIENWETIKPQLYRNEIMDLYQVYHDCGKPFCKTIDAEGKQHFPDHENVSLSIFEKYFPEDTYVNRIAAALIEQDMLFHVSNMETLDKIFDSQANETRQFYLSLWLTNLAELYSNREMFDADNQLSFKIKYKKLSKALNKILQHRNLI